MTSLHYGLGKNAEAMCHPVEIRPRALWESGGAGAAILALQSFRFQHGSALEIHGRGKDVETALILGVLMGATGGLHSQKFLCYL